MGKFIDLTGQRFGRLIVIYRDIDAENVDKSLGKEHRAKWKCLCDCGNEITTIGKSLRNGKTQSCGCLQKEIISLNTKHNLINQKFGRLTVIQNTENKKNGRTAWRCKCECGNECIVGTKELLNGDTKSCGCLRDKLLSSNLIGQRFNKLLVTSRNYDYHPYDGTFWNCTCDCGNEIITSGKRLQSGHCQSCGCLASKGEQLINSILSDNNINFISQYTFEDCLTENGHKCRFDFGIIDSDNHLKYLIEYDGQQHFEDSFFNLDKNQQRDSIKNDYCKKHNIPLIRIPYTHYENINITDLLIGESNYVL